MRVVDIVFNVLCGISVIVFLAIMWRLAKEARGAYDEDEHRGGGIG